MVDLRLVAMSFAINVSLNVRKETKRYEWEGAYLKAGHSNRCPQKAQMLNGEGPLQRGKGKANGLKGQAKGLVLGASVVTRLGSMRLSMRCTSLRLRALLFPR